MESAGAMQGLIDRFPDIIWTVASGGRKAYVSPKVVQVLGYSPDELYAMGEFGSHELVHPDDVAALTAAHQLLFEYNVGYAIEVRMRHKAGHEVWILDRAGTTYDLNGIRYADGLWSDITERRKREAELKLFRSLMNQSSEGLFIVDAESASLLDFNDTAAISLGYSRPELSRLRWFDIDGALDGLDTWNAFVGDVRRNGSMIVEGIHRTRSGLRNPVEVNAKHVEVDSRRYVVVLVRDISERKLAEDALRQSHAILAARVAERTAEVEQMMANVERARVSQVRFVANASHDLRTPLTVVRAELDLLRESSQADAVTRAALERIDRESRRMDRIASDLLMLATLDAHNPSEQMTGELLDDVILGCVAEAEMRSADKAIIWDVRCDDVPPVFVARPALARAIANVLDNAIAFSPICATISISLAAAGGFAVIEIADHGCGIDPDELQRIFDRFYRTDRSRSTPGAGLGLAIVRSVIDLHHGEVQIASTPGAGTVIRLLLPL